MHGESRALPRGRTLFPAGCDRAIASFVATAGLGRMQAVTFTLVRHGFGEIVGRLGLPRFGGPQPSEDAGSVSRDRLGKRMARVLADLGPTYVKLGQLMATREDLLPPEITAALWEV